MEDRAENSATPHVALYRRYLREGVDTALAAEYLRQLADEEAELAEIVGSPEKRE